MALKKSQTLWKDIILPNLVISSSYSPTLKKMEVTVTCSALEYMSDETLLKILDIKK